MPKLNLSQFTIEHKNISWGKEWNQPYTLLFKDGKEVLKRANGHYSLKGMVQEYSKSVDMTPTWRSLVDIYAQACATGSMDAQAELHRCADMADCFNQIVKLSNEQDMNKPVTIPRAMLTEMISSLYQ